MTEHDAREVLLDIREAVKRLDAIINILFETSGAKPLPIQRRIEILYAAGLRPVEISRILGKSVTNVSVQLNLLRKKKKKKEKPAEAEAPSEPEPIATQ